MGQPLVSRLDVASTLDRDPRYLHRAELMTEGEHQIEAFLVERYDSAAILLGA
jgi:hypothetical protein